MMKLLYVHDHKLKYNNNVFYTTGGFSDEVTKRYTDVFENMSLMCRAIKTDKIESCFEIKNSNVEIIPFFCNKVKPKKSDLAIIKENVKNCDILMVRLPSMLGIYAAYCAHILKKKYCVEVVGYTWGSYWYKNLLGKVLAFPLEIINKKIIREANYVLYVTDDYLQKKYTTKGNSLGCSDVVLEIENTDVLTKRLKKINSMNRDNYIIGTLAQIDYKYKGHKTVLRAMSKLKEKGIVIEYRLAGSGDKAYIEKLAKKYGVLENVKFCGLIKHNDINKWLDDLDIYIQPSLTEGMPRSVIEAIYRAVPTIVSSAGGMYELVNDKCMYKKGDYRKLIKIFEQLNSDIMSEMANDNFSFSRKFNYIDLKEKRKKFYEMIKDDKCNGMV